MRLPMASKKIVPGFHPLEMETVACKFLGSKQTICGTPTINHLHVFVYLAMQDPANQLHPDFPRDINFKAISGFGLE
jgi:hypothetical protein